MRVGDLEVTPIIDAEGTFATVREVFPALTDEREAEARARAPELFRGDAWWLPMQVVLIRSPAAVVLVDTGLGPAPRDFMPEAQTFLLTELEHLDVGPDDVGVVVHTHLHGDHIGWDGAFPRARYVIHEDDWRFFTTAEELAARPRLRENVMPLHEAGAIQLIAGEAEIAPGVRALPTPGHTPGHVSVRIDAGGASAVVLGDVVVHMLQVLDPDREYVSDGDHELAVRTRRRFLGEVADEGVPVIAAHLYGVGRFVRDGDAFGWERAKEDGAPVE